VARVFEPDIPRIHGARSAWFFIDGYPDAFHVDEKGGRLVTVGRVLDPQTRTIPVIFELANPDGRLRIGQFAKVSIATGAPRRALAIPDSAVLDEAGKSLAYVMVEGESFERRTLTPGIRAKGWVEVVDGLEPGERVVTRGGYEIKLASASGVIPEHGHAH
jgi:multidrug efflux pump subunit AcrA (membrane-fusion protein)